MIGESSRPSRAEELRLWREMLAAHPASPSRRFADGELTVELERTSDAGPVQYEGTVNGRPFYFRAKYDEWTFTVADTLDEAIDQVSLGGPIFNREESYGVAGGSDASWMMADEAERIIIQCAREYLVERGESGAGGP